MDEPWSLLRVVVAVAGAVLIAALLWHWAGLRFTLWIVVRGGNVTVGGSALSGRRGAVIEFFRQDLPDVRRALVLGSWDGRRVRITYCSLARPQRQRLRNFLMTIL
jgi:hypothetical protein